MTDKKTEPGRWRIDFWNRRRQPEPAEHDWNLDVKRILFVTDAWEPQVNGVVQTLKSLFAALSAIDIEVAHLTPAGHRTLPLPSYPDIRLALTTRGQIARRMEEVRPDHVHIVTEGPLGIHARRVCLSRGLPFTTSYHTRFPEYLRARVPVPEAWSYRWLRAFHNSGSGTMVATPSLREELAAHGFDKLMLWGRGVDTETFHPQLRADLGHQRPVFLYVGRVAVEKNLPAFLDLDLPGTRIVVGDGPDLALLKGRYPHVVFAGTRRGEELARYFASADVFVFPSRTDTFGLVLLEALASGTPVAAYPVTGPADIFADGRGGALSADLRTAALKALEIPREEARAKALEYGWDACARAFMENVQQAQHDFAARQAA
ncbi:glycosyltransferase [Chelativorans sp. ZYF759]|uniref:glycosyltransferase family 4 protein n=1 Tax=Chelativorans sp. ZYF759 TaxID=2692213 RepID=UPI00145D213A|nr:glycosyltransferase family 1 protein [Chelativorans sp. ZYF759]NMG38504.1 glycosyltransferase [Chelativorans sp. ZYF759]